MIAVCYEIPTKHTNTLGDHNIALLDVQPGGTYNNHYALKKYILLVHYSCQSELMRRKSDVSTPMG